MISWMTDCFIDWLAAVDLAMTLKLSEGDRHLFCFCFFCYLERRSIYVPLRHGRARWDQTWMMRIRVWHGHDGKWTIWQEHIQEEGLVLPNAVLKKTLTSIKYSPLIIFSVNKDLLSLFPHYISIPTQSLACKLSICFSGCQCSWTLHLPVRPPRSFEVTWREKNKTTQLIRKTSLPELSDARAHIHAHTGLIILVMIRKGRRPAETW